MVRGATCPDELPIGFVNFFGRLSPEYNQRFLFDELLALMTSGHNVVSTVFAQCNRFYNKDCEPPFAPVGETAVVRGIQARFESGLYTNEFGSTLRGCAAGFGTCDLTLGADKVEQVLRAHMNAMPGFAGIRVGTFYDPSPELGWEAGPARPVGWTVYESPKFREGFAVLEKLGLSFDHCGLHTQILPLVQLAQDFPRVTIICDHCGCPVMVGPYDGKREEIFEQWKRDMAELSTCPNGESRLAKTTFAVVKSPAVGCSDSSVVWLPCS